MIRNRVKRSGLHRQAVTGFVVAAALALVGAACSDDDSGGSAEPTVTTDQTSTTATPAPAELEQLTVQLQSAPAGPMSFLYWAREEGLYRDAGIDLEILPGQSSQGTVEAVAQGQADIGLASGVAVILGANSGQPVQSIGHFYGASTFGLFVPGDETDPQAMARAVDGGSVLTVAGGPQNVLFDAFLQAEGVDPASVEKTNVPITSLIQLYSSGEGDGLITVVPFANALVQGERASSSLLFRDVTGIEPPDTAVVVQPSFLAEHEDLLRRFLSVSYTAFAEQRTNPTGTVAALVDAEPTLTTEIATGQLQGQLPFACAQDADGATVGQTAPAQWEDAIELFRTAGLIQDLSAADIYTEQFFEGNDPVSTEQC